MFFGKQNLILGTLEGVPKVTQVRFHFNRSLNLDMMITVSWDRDDL